MPRFNLDGDPDPNSAYKDSLEEEWGAYWAGVLAMQREDLYGVLAGAPVEPPPPNWWDKWGTTMLGFATASLFSMVQISMATAAEQTGYPVDWGFVLGQSENWANTYAFNLIKGINTTSEVALQEALSSFYANQINFEQLKNRVANQFGVSRAERIARTEIARGFERGQDIYEDSLGELGLITDRIWWTAENPCPTCRPNHGVLRGTGLWTVPGVPAHPFCQCWTEIVVVKPE